MKNANFIAIDFETATPKREPCQLGIAVVKEGIIVEKINYLIQPPGNKYSESCMRVHKITPNDTKDSPTFEKIWEEIKDYFEGNFIVAHKSDFDLDVLNKAINYNNLTHPIFMGSACTYKLSGLSLESACEKYGISLCNHHNGLCDAEACAQLFLKYLNGEFYNDIIKEDIDCVEEIEIPDDCLETVSGISYSYNPYKHLLFLEKCSENDPFISFTDNVISSLEPLPPFLNKRFIITGGTIFDRDHAYEIIKKLGGKKSSSVSKSLDYAILGEEPGPKKIEQLNELKKEGYSIKVLSDLEFVDFVKSTLKTLLK